MGSRGFDSIYSWGSATIRGLLLVRIVNPILHIIIMRAQGHLPPRAVVRVRTSAEAPRGARHRPPGRTSGFRRDGGNEAAEEAEKCKRATRRNLTSNSRKACIQRRGVHCSRAAGERGAKHTRFRN